MCRTIDSFSQRNVLRGIALRRASQGRADAGGAGEILDVAVDLRRSSATFGKSEAVRLSGENKRMLWMPAGFAHGFRVLSEAAHVLYKATDYYAPEFERTLAWNDPELNIRWELDGVKPPVSAKKTAAALPCAMPKPSHECGAICKMKAIIFGATGLLGAAFLREWQGDEVLRLGVEHLDIRDSDRVRQTVEEMRPDWIVLAAAYTDVDGCDSNSELAFAVNRDGAVNVAQAAKRLGAKLLFISTDYVFDGTKTTPYETGDGRNPQSVYGRTKAEAEVRLLEIVPSCCIVRTSWLFGVGGSVFRIRSLDLRRQGQRWMLWTISGEVRLTQSILPERSSSCAARMLQAFST